MNKFRLGAAALVAVGWLLAGCTATDRSGDEAGLELAGAAETAEATETPGAGDTTDREPAADDPDQANGAPGHDDTDDEDDRLSPLGQHLGYEIPGLGGGDQLELRRLEQETIAACMRREGFAYVAWVEDPAVVYVPVEEGLDPESRAFAETYGFGVSTQFYAKTDVGPALVGHSGDGSGVNFEENPNAAIRAGLGPEELLAYDRAFFGADSPLFGGSDATTSADDDPNGILAARQIFANGCIGEGQRAIDGEASALLDVFAVEILGMQQRAMADPRYVANADAIERCVHEAGFDFYRHTPTWATLAHFDDLMFRFDESIGGSPFEQLDEADLADMTAEEIDALYDEPRHIPDEARERLAEIQDLEARTATTVWDCGGSAAAERRVVDLIVIELQTDFIETNRSELEAFRR